MNVIGTVGLPGSGKGEAANVAEAAGIPVVVMGDVIRAECRRRDLDPAQHHGRIAQALREEEGDDAIAARTLPRIREAAAESDRDETVLVDGLRSTVELDRFREAFGDDFTLVAIRAPFELRAERLGERGRDDSDADLSALRERDAREIDLGLGETLDRADVEIDNTDSLTAFRERVREVLGIDGEAADRSDGGAEAAEAGGDGA
ncbi:AAA family ATPase [Halorubrum salinarum]|uniref:AAA family ATPase n=1 Tax=Halorubrum salinarum TaxID=2739057 RepID=A0A7D3YGD7_9EURY|nr:AAA family ATPase [Halorubrum salinarum]QKG93570.1 AAA family ATPase [Halorubrum salinarum]